MFFQQLDKATCFDDIEPTHLFSLFIYELKVHEKEGNTLVPDKFGPLYDKLTKRAVTYEDRILKDNALMLCDRLLDRMGFNMYLIPLSGLSEKNRANVILNRLFYMYRRLANSDDIPTVRQWLSDVDTTLRNLTPKDTFTKTQRVTVQKL